jgi:glycyl-tRNA synthetase
MAKSGRMKVPFGLLKLGKHLEMRLSPDNLYSVCEFEQMEMQFFCPGDEMKHYEFWKETRLKWHLSLVWVRKNFHDHEKLAHYKCVADIEFDFPFDSKN